MQTAFNHSPLYGFALTGLNTVTDAFSRFVLHCQAIDSLGQDEIDRICDELMKKYGMPERIRVASNGLRKLCQ